MSIKIFVQSILNTIVLPLIFGIYGIICIPFCIYRWTVARLLSKTKPHFGSMASSTTILFIDYLKDFHVQICVKAKLKGQINDKKFIDRFKNRIIFAQKSERDTNLVYPEFSQRIEYWIGYYFWASYESFDFNNHVTFIEELVDSASIENFIEKQDKMDPFLTSPWHLYVFNQLFNPNFPNSPETCIVLQIHRGMSDGTSLFNSLTRLCDDAIITRSYLISQPSMLSMFGRILTYPFRAGYDVAKFSDTFGKNQELPIITPPKKCLLESPNYCQTSQVSLSVLKEAAKNYKVTPACVLLTAVGRSIGVYHRKFGHCYPDIIHACVPFPAHSLRRSRMTNNLGVLQCFVPTGRKSFKDDLNFTMNMIECSKKSTVSFTVQIPWKLICCLPRPLRLLLTGVTTKIYKLFGIHVVDPSIFISNFLGPATQIAICGNKILELNFAVTDVRTTSAASFAILSYNDVVRVTVYSNSQRIHCEDLSEILDDQFNQICENRGKHSVKKSYSSYIP